MDFPWNAGILEALPSMAAGVSLAGIYTPQRSHPLFLQTQTLRYFFMPIQSLRSADPIHAGRSGLPAGRFQVDVPEDGMITPDTLV